MESSVSVYGTNSLDANLDGNTNDRAKLTSDPNLGRRTLNQWFNTSAVAQNPVVNGRPVDGNSPRNWLTGPATHTVDLNLARTFAITERAKYQFRAEAPNAFNIVNYGTPGTTVNTATFGAIRTNATTTPMRQTQFGGKILF